jgi:hypothetical protein
MSERRRISPRACRRGTIVFIAIFLAASRSAGAADGLVKPVRGYVARDAFPLATSTFLGGLAYSPDGHAIIYESASGEIRVHDGPTPRPIATLPPGTFGSFLVPLPDGMGLIFAESSSSNVYSVPYSGSGQVLADNIPLAFSLAFDGEGRGFVSALETGVGNRIVLLDGDPAVENVEVVAGIPGFSGPVAFDPAGNLYYGTAAPTLLQMLVRFTPAQLEAAIEGSPLAIEDGEVLIDDASGFFDLKWSGGKLYATDLGFSTNLGTLFAIDPATGFESSLLASFEGEEGLLSPGFLALRPGPRPFDPGEGPEGGALLVSYSNFTSVNIIAEITPELWFVRGRVNGDDSVNISDAIALLDHLFSGTDGPDPLDAGDLNDDESVDISDPIYLLEVLFRGGREIPLPYPEPGPDPTP